MQLQWPHEGARAPENDAARFAHAGSNLCLDFHGDAARAQVVVFSDGNHHMALADALALFRERNPAVGDVFYATTPPRVLMEALASGTVWVGNLALSVTPHVFLSPVAVLERLRGVGRVHDHVPFAASRGNVLLVGKGNPRGIARAADLARPDVRLFLSNPRTETASYEVYAATLKRIAVREGLDFSFLDRPPGESSRVVHGELIHHREAPQSIVDGRADAAVVFEHLALRYVRIFPESFEIVALAPEHSPDQAINTVHAGLVDGGGAWGPRLLAHLLDDEVAAIYRYHGLQPAPRPLN